MKEFLEDLRRSGLNPSAACYVNVLTEKFAGFCFNKHLKESIPKVRQLAHSTIDFFFKKKKKAFRWASNTWNLLLLFDHSVELALKGLKHI